MEFIYTKHAVLRINQRELSKKQIEDTLSNPDKMHSSFSGRHIAKKDFGTKRLEVVYKKLNGEIVIITTYWLKEGG